MKVLHLSGALLGLAASSASAAENAFPKVDGFKFNVDGKTEYLRGTNGYWIPFLGNNADIDLTMDHIAASGMKLLRTWGFNDVNQIPAAGMVPPYDMYYRLLSANKAITQVQDSKPKLPLTCHVQTSRTSNPSSPAPNPP